jgi:hypothetical protein
VIAAFFLGLSLGRQMQDLGKQEQLRVSALALFLEIGNQMKAFD